MLICAHCSEPMRGRASFNGLPLCHPDKGVDCYHLVTVYGHAMPCSNPACVLSRGGINIMQARIEASA